MEQYKLVEDFWVSQGGKPHMEADIYFFESSWDMLMPVVEKISAFRMAYPNESSYVCDSKVVVNINALFVKVVEFIEWHNKQPK